MPFRCITVDYKLYNFFLGYALYDIDSQSATNIRMFVDTQLSSYGLSLNSKIFVVTDNENEMHAAFKDRCICIGCSIHYLNKQFEYDFTSEEIDKRFVKCDKVHPLFENIKQIITHIRQSHPQVKLKQKLDYTLIHVLTEHFIW